MSTTTVRSRTPRLSLLAATGLTLGLGGCDIIAPDPEPRDRIIFASEVLAAIAAARPDGSGFEVLTDGTAVYRWLTVAPDGERIAFYSDRSGCYDIWTMRTDGGDLTQLTGVAGLEGCNRFPKWSPDGSRIAFDTSRDSRDGLGSEVYVMNADGSGVFNLTRYASSDYVHGWSPDGRVIVLSDRSGEFATYLIDPDGTAVERFLDGLAYPVWSPDGSRIAYEMDDVTGNTDVWVMNADGSDRLNLTSHPADDRLAATPNSPWSPDGRYIAIERYDPALWAVDSTYVVVIGKDGSGDRAIRAPGQGTPQDRFVTWSPDGRRVLFTRRGEPFTAAIGDDAVPLTVEGHEALRVLSALWIR